MTVNEIYVLRGGQQFGPFEEHSLRVMIDEGQFQSTDLAWHEQLTEWTPLRVVFNLSPEWERSRLASPLHRLGSAAIDVTIVLLGVIVAWSVLIYFAGKGVDPNADPTLGEVVAPYWGLFWSIPLITLWLYCAPAESSPAQATFGKRILGLRVVGADGNSLPLGRATLRVAGRACSILTLGIGFAMCAWTRNRQCLHDFVARNVVVRRK